MGNDVSFPYSPHMTTIRLMLEDIDPNDIDDIRLYSKTENGSFINNVTIQTMEAICTLTRSYYQYRSVPENDFFYTHLKPGQPLNTREAELIVEACKIYEITFVELLQVCNLFII